MIIHSWMIIGAMRAFISPTSKRICSMLENPSMIKLSIIITHANIFAWVGQINIMSFNYYMLFANNYLFFYSAKLSCLFVFLLKNFFLPLPLTHPALGLGRVTTCWNMFPMMCSPRVSHPHRAIYIGAWKDVFERYLLLYQTSQTWSIRRYRNKAFTLGVLYPYANQPSRAGCAYYIL